MPMMLKPYWLRFHRWITLVFALPLLALILSGLVLSLEPLAQRTRPAAPVTEALVLEVPNGLTTDQAVLTEPFAVGEHAVAKARLDRDSVCMVVGCGPVGLAVIAALKARGHGPVIATDYSPRRRAAAWATRGGRSPRLEGKGLPRSRRSPGHCARV